MHMADGEEAAEDPQSRDARLYVKRCTRRGGADDAVRTKGINGFCPPPQKGAAGGIVVSLLLKDCLRAESV